MKALKTALSLLMVFCIVLSIGAAAFADDGPAVEEAGNETQTVDSVMIYNNGNTVEVSTPSGYRPVSEGNPYPDNEAPLVTVTAATENTPTTVVIDANIVSSGNANGITAGGNGGNLDISVLDVDSEASGIILSRNKGSITVSAGDIDADWYGINADYNSGTITASAGDVTSEKIGVVAEASTATSTAEIKVGSIDSSSERAIAARVADGGNVTVIADGDASAGGYGMSVDETGDSSNVDVLINGTLSSEQEAIWIVNDQVTEDNLSLTVWKVEAKDSDGDGDAIVTGGSGSAKPFTDSSIQYIIRVQTPETEQGSLTATGKNGQALDKDSTLGTYDVAHEGDTVVLKVTVEEGYELKGAFNNSELITTRDEDGNYYIVVPKGGGVDLSVELVKTEPQPEPKPEPKPQPVTIEVVSSAVKCTFDLDGGTLDGETGKVIKWFVPGSTVKLPAAPSKDGFTFAGWETKVDGEKKVFEADEKFTVTGAQSFTALWEET